MDYIKSAAVKIKYYKRALLQGALVLALAWVTIHLSQPQLKSVFSLSVNNRKLPIYCVDTPEKKLSISFDAAWGADDTDEILRILADNDVKATFFLCGYWVDKYPEEVKKMFEAGHDIGNHSDTHPHSATLSLDDNKKEILAVHKKVKDLLGIEMDLYRPPFGEYNNTVIEAADSLGYYTIQWDIDSLETKIEVIKPLINQSFQTTSIVLS